MSKGLEIFLEKFQNSKTPLRILFDIDVEAGPPLQLPQNPIGVIAGYLCRKGVGLVDIEGLRG